MSAVVFVPGERGAVVSEIAGERGHIVGGVGEAEHVVSDEFAGGGVSEPAVVGVGRDYGELFDDEQVQGLALQLLPGHEVEGNRV